MPGRQPDLSSVKSGQANSESVPGVEVLPNTRQFVLTILLKLELGVMITTQNCFKSQTIEDQSSPCAESALRNSETYQRKQEKKTLCGLPQSLYFLPLASVRLQGLMLLANKEVVRLSIGDEAQFLKGLACAA